MTIPDTNIKMVRLRDIRDIIDSIRSKVKKTAVEAYIFGSVVEGSAVQGESDLDLLIIPSEKLDWYSLLENELFQLLDRGIVLHIHVADNESYKTMIRIAKEKGLKL